MVLRGHGRPYYGVDVIYCLSSETLALAVLENFRSQGHSINIPNGSIRVADILPKTLLISRVA